MIRWCLVSFALVAGLGVAQAQTTVAPAAPAAAPMAPAPTGKGGLAQKACLSEVDAKPLTGDQRKAEMHSCMQARRQTCVQSAEAQNVPKSAGQRRDFVRKCMQGT